MLSEKDHLSSGLTSYSDTTHKSGSNPELMLALVDEQAKREGETRSGLLARAVLDYIGRNKVA